MNTLRVNCKKQEITLIINIWIPPNNFFKDDIKLIRKVVKEQLNPKAQLMYFSCKVFIKISISQKNRKPKNHHLFEAGKPDGNVGGGATAQKGGGKFVPTSSKHIIINPAHGRPRPETIGHELGHALGIDDPTPTTKWDKNGIQDEHITEIFDKASFRLKDGRLVGWHHQAHCCRATDKAITIREY